jgi:hypothetical protein
VFSLGRKRVVYVVLDQARKEWPALTGLALGFQLGLSEAFGGGIRRGWTYL